MKINIVNTTKYNQIKFHIYYCYKNDGIAELGQMTTDFYQIKKIDTIEFDLTGTIYKLEIYIKRKDDGYYYKFKHEFSTKDINLELNNGNNYPVLTINKIDAYVREDWEEPPIAKCIDFLFLNYKKI